jgi:hypothetical protein
MTGAIFSFWSLLVLGHLPVVRFGLPDWGNDSTFHAPNDQGICEAMVGRVAASIPGFPAV